MPREILNFHKVYALKSTGDILLNIFWLAIYILGVGLHHTERNDTLRSSLSSRVLDRITFYKNLDVLARIVRSSNLKMRHIYLF